MDATATIRALELLADGRDPATGLPLPDASPYNQPAVVRSLFAAIRAVELAARSSGNASTAPAAARMQRVAADEAITVQAVPQNSSTRTSPANAGKPWSDKEDEALCTAFDQGVTIKDLAVQHGRSTTALNARLFKLGKIADPGIPLRHPVQPSGKKAKLAGDGLVKPNPPATSAKPSARAVPRAAA
jgi:hypothetical protein